MIQQFPVFSKFGPHMKQEIKSFTSQYEPYSDFNFVSIFAWDVDNSAEVAMLNGNLVISLPDYITGEKVHSILGRNQIDESLRQLLSAVHKLVLVPEIVVQLIQNQSRLVVAADRDNFDYLYSLEEHAALAGKKFLPKRKKYNRFFNHFGDRIQISDIDFAHHDTPSQIEAVAERWAESKNQENVANSQELVAINRLLDNTKLFNLVGTAMHLDGQPVGFSIYEILGDGNCMSHFHKTDPALPNSDVFLTCEAAKMLLRNNCNRVNWEQDLGLEGLRESKLSYKPFSFLKKYKISPAG